MTKIIIIKITLLVMSNIVHIYPVTHKVATTVASILQISKPRYKNAKLPEIPTAKKMPRPLS